MNTVPEAVRLREAVTNLLDNVYKYTRSCGRIQISLETYAECLELVVEQVAGDGAGAGSRFVVRLPPTCTSDAPATKRASVVRGALLAWQLKRVLQFIHENLERPLTVVEIAALLGQSAGHFHRNFKRTLGTTVHQYVMIRRIEMAQQLMMNTSEPLSNIALACGLCDQSHLTRWFTRVAGETPSRWRRARVGAAIMPKSTEDLDCEFRQGDLAAL